MGWQTEQFGSSHEGRAGAVLADGSEPKPVYLDVGSGGGGHTTSHWRVYDGTLGTRRATHLRGSCACGWRGTRRYAIDWSHGDEVRYDTDTSGPHADWVRHIGEVEARSIPLPAELQDLLGRLGEQLGALAMDAPLAALKAVAALERTTGRIGREAAANVEADELSWEVIGKALGLTEAEARSRLIHYSLRH
ncbi:MAG: hypothetical protein JO362_04240 [Streptomycetaceae bacterium]|nr:hypothetical protein [Streptomycetaceae bacterium]